MAHYKGHLIEGCSINQGCQDFKTDNAPESFGPPKWIWVNKYKDISKNISKGEVKMRIKLGTTVDASSEDVSVLPAKDVLSQHYVSGQVKKNACVRIKDQVENQVAPSPKEGNEDSEWQEEYGEWMGLRGPFIVL
ncbi:hypothetical protein U1Q18_037760 [Sarracenia purpurea var. burkii]